MVYTFNSGNGVTLTGGFTMATKYAGSTSMSFKQVNQYDTLSSIKVTPEEVDAYYALMVEHFGVDNFSHKCSNRNTRNTRGSCRTFRDRTTREIQSIKLNIYPQGMNVAVVAHEFAHVVAGHANGHNRVFSNTQEELFTMADGLLY